MLDNVQPNPTTRSWHRASADTVDKVVDDIALDGSFGDFRRVAVRQPEEVNGLGARYRLADEQPPIGLADRHIQEVEINIM